MKPFPALRAGRHVAAPISHAPNAALLIDFDNVTLGVRSDLTKELRHLLNSEIIKGKVAVQRAYADWRRYPQYIVPLSESSIDLIFAPAFGTNKKNATDIRLAVDAIELVFTRPEIGTFILLSGDSDFSSLVLKLKEYGKYVIGVGIRESASDILIQNCDEYYSYSDLAGLTRESDLPTTARDPWELVVEATAQMQRNGDVMRSDRLKQVMQQIDPNFDESNAGFNRFSKFVTEAGNRGLIKVIRQENGQFDVASGGAAPAVSRDTPAPAAREPGRGRGRGRGGRGASAPSASATPAAATAATSAASTTAAAPAKKVEPTGDTPAEREERAGRRRRRGRGRGGRTDEATPAPAEPTAAAEPVTGLTLAEAFHLLSRALGELPAPAAHETVRARMAALHGKEDPLLDSSRFGRFLRQANDAEIADVRVISDDQFELSPHKTDLAMQMRTPAVAAEGAGESGGTTTSSTPRPAALRYRSGARTGAKRSEVSMVGVINLDPPEPAAAPGVDSSAATQPEAVAAPAAPVAAKKTASKTAAPKQAASAKSSKKTAKSPASTAKTAKAVKKGAKIAKSAKAAASAKGGPRSSKAAATKTPAG
ncbi:MAG: NYN domain-containing protein [Gemmatimonadales bacterium]|nr:NYN domain-containing protein [Gemmatimonadales bacterium]MBA3574238.1 NYN domain-containing protein [Pseudonocardiales bacterium]